MALQTILGSGGSIGVALALALKEYTKTIRLVSRNPKKVNPEDECFPADITKKDQLDKAIKGSEITYLTVGFAYKYKIWKSSWPDLMTNTIVSCQRHGSKLVFFDNVYMYDRDFLDHMTEETPVRPTSKKGVIRAEIAEMLLKTSTQGNIKALIARSADFIGTRNSILIEMVARNLAKGKKAIWMADAKKIHSFTYTGDAAKGTAMLGNDPDAYGQIWHLPTSKEKLTGSDWIDLVADELDVKPRFQVLPVWLMNLMGVFVPLMKELKEMAYQYERNYFFDSTKFENHFGYSPVTSKSALKQVLKKMAF